MKTVFVLFDSLNRLAISPYAGAGVNTPNFQRLADRGVTFDRHYVGSLPCMPARRDMQTGRLNFLHRNWGPLEPFDNSLPQILRDGGGYAHMITDHYHYFHDGGATYHNRFSSWELVRGQSTDDWKGVVEPPLEQFAGQYHKAQQRPFTLHDKINRLYVREESEFSCPQVFGLANEFLDTNRKADNWFLQVESFDPHEPFYAPPRFREAFPTNYSGPTLDWPMYARVTETGDEIAEVRANYAALVAMCDHYLGTLLDTFDALDLWRDTALVVTTDHGFLLGEHEWWGKNLAPVYDEIARVPLIVWHPDHAAQAGTRRRALTQVTDLMPTMLEWFGRDCPPEVTGYSLTPVLADDTPVRDSAIYGYFGAACNVTDGRYTYLRYPESLDATGLHEYTLMPTRFGRMFSPEELRGAELAPPFDFTKGVPVLKLPPQVTEDNRASAMDGVFTFQDAETRLYDTDADPAQEHPVGDPAVAARLAAEIARHFVRHDAPSGLYARLGLEPAP
ncbi:MAG: sulfatase [Rhodobacteraceae bacterium]|nr:sulfatase [Paracoccaceae bacterium]